MAGDDRPSRELSDAIGLGFQNVIEGLRRDVREDIRELREELAKTEGRVTERVVALDVKIALAGADWHSFTLSHGIDHEKEAEERRQTHGQFYDFIRKAELDAARQAGALGVFRFLVEKLASVAPRLVALILSIVAALLTLTGQVDIRVGS